MIQEEARRFIGKGERRLERKRYELIDLLCGHQQKRRLAVDAIIIVDEEEEDEQKVLNNYSQSGENRFWDGD